MPTLARLLNALLRRRPPAHEPPSDAELLARFAANRDSAAFELLVWRHGAMVLGACRRILRHEQSAEDAFQATFLILARKAAIVRGHLAGWLHTTARRVCLRLRKKSAFASLDAEQAAEPTAPAPDGDAELAALLDDEIARLPDKFRVAVVLCYLRGLTTEQAAAELGIPRGTVLSRLAAARKRLVERLTAKGVTVPATFLTAALTTPELAAQVAPIVTVSAVEFVTVGGLTSIPSQLAMEVLSMTARKTVLTVTLTAMLVAGVGTSVGWALADGEQKPDGPKPVAQPAPKEQPLKAEPLKPLPPPDLRELGPDHPLMKRRAEQSREIEKRIALEQAQLVELRDQVEKIGRPRAGQVRQTEELIIDLAKKKLDAELALAGSKIELRDAEAIYKQASGKADEYQKFSAEVVALSERLAVVRGKERELSATLDKRKAVLRLGGGAADFEKEQTALETATKERIEIESVLQARQNALLSVTTRAAEADTKRQAVERAKTSLAQCANKLEVIQEKFARLEMFVDTFTTNQQRLALLDEEQAFHQQQLNRLKAMKADLELSSLMPADDDKPENKLDRILKQLEELRRDVKKLVDDKK